MKKQLTKRFKFFRRAKNEFRIKTQIKHIFSKELKKLEKNLGNVNFKYFKFNVIPFIN